MTPVPGFKSTKGNTLSLQPSCAQNPTRKPLHYYFSQALQQTKPHSRLVEVPMAHPWQTKDSSAQFSREHPVQVRVLGEPKGLVCVPRLVEDSFNTLVSKVSFFLTSWACRTYTELIKDQFMGFS